MPPPPNLIIIGSGIAGLSLAYKVAKAEPSRQITIITKGEMMEANTRYAQGGIAVVKERVEDSFESHIQDTLIAGGGVGDEEVIRSIVEEAPQRLMELEEMGAEFDRGKDGEYQLGREGGHSFSRVVHRKDETGAEMERASVHAVNDLPNVSVFPYHFLMDLITIQEGEEERCFGVWAIDLESKEIKTFLAQAVVLASGGCGQVYQATTNPSIATGDGLAVAMRKGVKVKDLEYIQFHPTAYDDDTLDPRFLVSEAVRGAGAWLLNPKGERFMPRYDERAELAPRDVVTSAIFHEMEKDDGDPCFLDCTQLDSDDLRQKFPAIHAFFASRGLDITQDLIPIVPAAHYCCGGIEVDLNGRTSLSGLYAAGEVACTGMHGANRLASNSLLEAVSLAHWIANDLSRNRDNDPLPDNPPSPPWELVDDRHHLMAFQDLRIRIKEVMTTYVGAVRKEDGLQKAHDLLKGIMRDLEARMAGPVVSKFGLETWNMVGVGLGVVEARLSAISPQTPLL